MLKRPVPSVGLNQSFEGSIDLCYKIAVIFKDSYDKNLLDIGLAVTVILFVILVCVSVF